MAVKFGACVFLCGCFNAVLYANVAEALQNEQKEIFLSNPVRIKEERYIMTKNKIDGWNYLANLYATAVRALLIKQMVHNEYQNQAHNQEPNFLPSDQLKIPSERTFPVNLKPFIEKDSLNVTSFCSLLNNTEENFIHENKAYAIDFSKQIPYSQDVINKARKFNVTNFLKKYVYPLCNVTSPNKCSNKKNETLLQILMSAVTPKCDTGGSNTSYAEAEENENTLKCYPDFNSTIFEIFDKSNHVISSLFNISQHNVNSKIDAVSEQSCLYHELNSLIDEIEKRVAKDGAKLCEKNKNCRDNLVSNSIKHDKAKYVDSKDPTVPKITILIEGAKPKSMENTTQVTTDKIKIIVERNKD